MIGLSLIKCLIYTVLFSTKLQITPWLALFIYCASILKHASQPDHPPARPLPHTVNKYSIVSNIPDSNFANFWILKSHFQFIKCQPNPPKPPFVQILKEVKHTSKGHFKNLRFLAGHQSGLQKNEACRLSLSSFSKRTLILRI